MSDFKRYYIGVYGGEAQARACGMGVNEIIRDSDGEIFILASDCDRVTAERDGLQLSLSTADQTIDDLNAAISRRTHRVRELEAQLAYAVDALNEVVKASAMYEKPFEIATLAIGEMSAMAEQPAPVAVVLPERREVAGEGGHTYYIPVGWNACLDEVTRLNAKPR